MMKDQTVMQGAKTALWDQMAKNYDGYHALTRDNNPLIQILEDRALLTPESRVLDLGCASGKYSFYFAEHCKEVVGVDISSIMIQNAKRTKAELHRQNVTFLCGDWELMDVEQIGGPESFDLVFANMTPAVAASETLKKMMAVSRGWCFYGGPVKRTRGVNDGVYRIFNLPLHTQQNEQRIPKVFADVWNSGYLPELQYVESHAQWEMPLEKAFEYYLSCSRAMLAMRGITEICEGQLDALQQHLHALQNNGMVREEIDGVNAILIWNKKEKEAQK